MTARAPWRPPGLGRRVLWFVCRAAVLAWFVVFYRLRMSGRGHLPRTGAVIVASNHQSHLDPLLLGLIAGGRRPIAQIARATLFRPPLSWLMRPLGAIAIDRDGGRDTTALRLGVDVLRAGCRLGLFPEGTRSPDGTLGTMRPGVAVLMRRGRAPIVPVAIEGAWDVWPRGERPRLTGRSVMRAGAPIPLETLERDGADAVLERLRREIERMRLELRAELRRRTGGRRPAAGPADAPYWAADEREPEPAT